MSWITSTACKGPLLSSASSSDVSSFELMQEWTAYILFAQCPQYIIASVFHTLFLASTAARLAATRKTKCISVPLTFNKTLIATLFLSTCFAIITFATLAFTICGSGHGDYAAYTVFGLLSMSTETLAWIVSIVFLGLESSICIHKHGYALRLWWFSVWTMSFLRLLGCIFRLKLADFTMFTVGDVSIIVRFLISFYFLYKSVYAPHTGAHAPQQVYGNLKAPLLKAENSYASHMRESSYASRSSFSTASFFSRLTLSWLSPLLVSGSKTSLEMDDVPELAHKDEAESMYALFLKNWPQDSKCMRPMTVTIFKSFWLQIIYTGLLQLVRSFVMFCGPLLIPSFTSYAYGVYVTSYDGYALVALLLLSKIVEIIALHQCNFLCYKLGNNIRTGISTMLYHKALRLSSASRQIHGVGTITNYMVVDAQQISEACLQLHLLWAVPLQVLIAITILFYVLGLSSVGGLLVMVLIGLFNAWLSQKQRYYQDYLMNFRDTRMRAIIEALAYIKVIKLQAWEEKFRERVEYLRQKEFTWLTKFVLSTSYNSIANWNTQSLISTITYLVAVLIGTRLSISIIFTAASVFRIIQSPIRNLPQAFTSLSQILISLNRLDKFMLASELQEGAVSRNPVLDEYPVVVENGSFAWGEAGGTKPTIKEINLNVKKGSLVMIVGKVGSGKSSLLSALLGEMVKLCGKAKTCGSSAYVPQNAWIQNATIEDNILFGERKESTFYGRVLDACALVKDLQSMDYGDQTEIGERGINLSGGQKQRIQLARAVYQNADVYLLDDIFSAVDAHTGAHIFKECILGALHGKTILLVTHQVEFLARADVVLVMKDGRISQAGRYETLLTEDLGFKDLIAAYRAAMDLVNKNDSHQEAKCAIAVSTSLKLNEIRIASVDGSQKTFSSTSSIELRPDIGSRLIEAEQRESGKVSFKLYKEYLTKAYGFKGVIMLLLGQVIWQVLLVWSDFWISQEIPASVSESYDSTKFITVYTSLNAASWLAVVIRIMVVAAIGLKAAQLFFLQMLHKIFRAPMSFFDTTPSGRILSRFSSDQANLDFAVHYYVGGMMACWINVLSIIVVICLSAWPIIIFMVPLTFLFKWYQDFFLASSREMTRLDSISKGPLIYHTSETVAGIETIRCFLKQKQFELQNFQLINSNMKMDFCNSSANEWLGFRLDGINTAIITITAILFVALPASVISPEIVGLALSYALSLNAALFLTVSTACTAENKMVSVERVNQFTSIGSEADLSIKSDLMTPSWPSAGRIVSTRLKLRYRPGTPLILKGVSFTIEGGHKVGVVGRTGSGKSTLLLALFRLVEPVGGQLLIDDVDITQLGLYDLRSRLGIVPQEPVLFEGTVRMNLDPFNSYSDDEIWMVLRKCQLARVLQETPEKLEAPVAEYGGNWSVGQRQLLCFGRALLKRSKLLFLDEATASVDAQTDGVIQDLIRQELQDCTVVSIAHRIPTVMDADRVLVMDAGRAKEYDAPAALLNDPRTLFASLVNEYRLRSEILQ